PDLTNRVDTLAASRPPACNNTDRGVGIQIAGRAVCHDQVLSRPRALSNRSPLA
ncbi:MAG: hypothetical protein ACI853_001051, partial [Paracoccaceae bacterium]